MTESTDRELIELAAKAAGIDLMPEVDWSPLEYDADAFRLAVDLGILVLTARGFATANARDSGGDCVRLESGADPYTATRRAITMAAAEIGKEMGK